MRNVGGEDGVGGEVLGGCREGRVDEEGVDVWRRGGKGEVCERRGHRLCDLGGERRGDVVGVDIWRPTGLEWREFGLDLIDINISRSNTREGML